MSKKSKFLICLDGEALENLSIIQKKNGLNRSSAIRLALKNEVIAILRARNQNISKDIPFLKQDIPNKEGIN
ncbi:MAG: hypothetical protein PHD05_02465 [Sphaerochaetaceae bacterium]|nr:hypothetical protein [Sphaerochaetaceae bacterium]